MTDTVPPDATNVGPPAPRAFIGWDPKEMMAHVISASSLQFTSSRRVDTRRLALLELRMRGLYTRPTEIRDGQLYDVVSQAPMSTEHAISRFFVPFLCDYDGWALFTDGDVLVRQDVMELFGLAAQPGADRHAVFCVQHPSYLQAAAGIKKDGVPQLPYPRKNWSSVMLFNCGHAANRALDLRNLNAAPGRELHAFSWLDDDEIGALPAKWNWLVGVNDQPEDDPACDPALVHFTLGTPNLPNTPPSRFNDEWWDYARTCGYDIGRRGQNAGVAELSQ